MHSRGRFVIQGNMRQNEITSAIESTDSEQLATSNPSVYEFAILEELQYVRRAAQAEADLAYLDWAAWPGVDGYAVYRAAQDRADAAQDELADWSVYAGTSL